jgi:hypothetical protein
LLDNIPFSLIKDDYMIIFENIDADPRQDPKTSYIVEAISKGENGCVTLDAIGESDFLPKVNTTLGSASELIFVQWLVDWDSKKEEVDYFLTLEKTPTSRTLQMQEYTINIYMITRFRSFS